MQRSNGLLGYSQSRRRDHGRQLRCLFGQAPHPQNVSGLSSMRALHE
jgi:hypothetical protein